MQTIHIELEIFTDSFLHVGTGEGFAGIIDRRTLSHKKNEQRYPIVFGHTVKGIIKDEFRKLSSTLGLNKDLQSDVFGTENVQGTIYFSPWELSEGMESVFKNGETENLFTVKASNQIDRRRRVAKPEHLFTNEVVQDHLVWRGKIEGEVSSDQIQNNISETLLLLLFAIKSVKRIGGKRRSGTGACTVSIKSLKVDNVVFEAEQVLRLLENNADRLVRGHSING